MRVQLIKKHGYVEGMKLYLELLVIQDDILQLEKGMERDPEIFKENDLLEKLFDSKVRLYELKLENDIPVTNEEVEEIKSIYRHRYSGYVIHKEDASKIGGIKYNADTTTYGIILNGNTTFIDRREG